MELHHRSILAFVLGFFFVTIIVSMPIGSQDFCLKYSLFETQFNRSGYHEVCINGTDFTYCRYFGCPHINDIMQECQYKILPTPDNECSRCPDTCVYNGELIEVGIPMDSIDGKSTCTCQMSGLVLCHLKQPIDIVDPADFCIL